jgi:thiol-disulfide isomerase/thioredoxin
MSPFTSISTAILSLGLATATLAQNSPFRCVLIGKVLNRPDSKELLLIKESEDLRMSSISIPIIDGRFEYTMIVGDVESYTLNFKDEVENGTWKPVVFFAESDTLFITLYPQNMFFKNTIEGGRLNMELKAHHAKAESLFRLHSLEKEQKQLQEEGKDLTEEAKILQKKIQQEEDKVARDSLVQVAIQLEAQQKAYTPEAEEIRALQEKGVLAWVEWQTEQILASPSLITYRDLLSLFVLADTPHNNPLPISVGDLLASFEKDYQPKYPNHPYTQWMDTYLKATKTIRKGGKYLDFSAPDFNETMVKLSDRIKGKYALINLWASWCGPCRRKGIDMIPVYEEFKDSGFEIVGVARERNKERGINAAKLDKYPWLNLLEINDNEGIWRKYGIGNSGGGIFLVDSEGIIVAVSPTTEEVKAILKESL